MQVGLPQVGRAVERESGDQKSGAAALGTGRGAAHFMGAGTMRLIVQPTAGRFELCARLGLLLIPAERLNSAGHGGKIVHAALDAAEAANVIAERHARWHRLRH
jgi:hypothetical protein